MENKEEKNVKINKESNNKGENKKLLIIVAIIVVIIIIVGITVYKKFASDNCENNNVNINTNTLDPSNSWELIIPKGNGSMYDKPIIYLYPQETTELSVQLGNPEKVTCSYPEYKDEWRVIANPDGTLIDINTQRELYSLYWEGKDMTVPEMKEGFVVKGEDTAKFLEDKLAILGLNEREAEEFIIYWLPQMQKNKYNYIRFASIEEINEYMPLEFSIQPDTIIRILMQYKALDEYVEIQEQKLESPKREGFVVVEWGGSEIK